MDILFATVKAILEQQVCDQREIGVQAAAYYRGELIVDAWAGAMDAESGRKVGPETLFGIMSSSKGIVATCVHLLLDRGLIALDAPVCEYWPEFGTHGKETTTIRDVLTHRAGLPRNPDGYRHEMALNWGDVCTRVAGLTPAWEPGTRTGYHALNFGWILGEVIRRVDGRTLDRFLQEELREPLALDSLFMGVPPGMEERAVTLVVDPSESTNSPLRSLVEDFNQPHIRACTVPAVGAFVNARSLARHYAMLAQGGELDGIRVLSCETVEQASRLQTEEIDEVYKVPIRKALGYWLGGPAMRPLVDQPKAFGHPGLGGSIGFADPESQLGFAFTKNSIKLRMDLSSAQEVIAAVYEHLNS